MYNDIWMLVWFSIGAIVIFCTVPFYFARRDPFCALGA